MEAMVRDAELSELAHLISTLTPMEPVGVEVDTCTYDRWLKDYQERVSMPLRPDDPPRIKTVFSLPVYKVQAFHQHLRVLTKGQIPTTELLME